MTQQNDLAWVTIKTLYYDEPDSSRQLNLFLENGLSCENGMKSYIPLRLKVQIIDNSITNGRIETEFHYIDAFKLNRKLEKISSNLGEQFKVGTQVTSTKMYYKNKKDMTLTFGVSSEKKPFVKVTIVDPSSPKIDKLSVFLDYPTYLAFSNYLLDFEKNYNLVSSNMIQAATQNKFINYMEGLQNAVEQLQIDLYNGLKNGYNRNQETVEVGEPKYVDDEEDVTFEGNSLQNDFESKIDLNEIDLELPEGLEEPSNKPKTPERKPIMPFIGTLLSYDPNVLKDRAYAILNKNDSTDATSFSEIKNIETICLGTKVLNDPRVLKAEYVLNSLFKKNVKKYLRDGKFDAIPAFEIPKELSEIMLDDDFYKFSGEISLLFGLYTWMIQNQIKNIENLDDSNDFVNSIKITHNYIRTFLIGFPCACKDKSKLKEEIVKAGSECQENGFLTKLSKVFEEKVPGGKFNVNRSTFEKIAEDLVGAFGKNIKTVDVNEYKEICDKYDITWIDDVDNEETLKKCITTGDAGQTKEASKTDEKLELFLTCTKKLLDPVTIENIKENCNSFKDLVSFLRDHNVDEEVIKIKRVMDQNPDLTKRSEVMKLYKEFKEDPTVTENRVMAEEEVDDLENVDDIDFDKMLFGDE